MKSRLIVFTRYPVPGTTKTRLIPALGEEGAAQLHREMTEHTLNRVRPLLEDAVTLQVRFEGGDQGSMAGWLGDDLRYEPQGGGDLGDRMRRAMESSFREGARRAVLIGTDCPALHAGDVEEALDLLQDNPVVLGPSADGGYYLIALRAPVSDALWEALFRDIPWGTGQVLAETVNAVAATGLDLGLLDEKEDVDEPGDLPHWEKERAQGEGRRAKEKPSWFLRLFPWFSPAAEPEPDDVSASPSTGTGTLSVIIPTLNEEGMMKRLLEEVGPSGAEVVVVDGGSSDGTVEAARRAGFKVLPGPQGRAAQMNAGAAAAQGDVFLFLHADTRLPTGFAREVRRALDRGAAGGAFLFGTDSKERSMKVVELGANFRARWLGIVLGDQAIFCTREAFRKAGGFPRLPIMEDYEFWKRLRRAGRTTLLPLAASTSARRWREHGTLRTTLVNQAVMWLYMAGISPERLARWYRRML